MTINGQLTTIKDYSKPAKNGKSIKGLVFNYNCRIKIVYEGRGSKIYLISKTTSVNAESSAIAN